MKKNILYLLIISSFTINNAYSDTQKTDSVYKIDDIEVEGNYFKKSLYSYPGSVSIVSENDIKKAHVTTISDLKGKLPGLTFISPQNGGDEYILIRGIGDFTDENNRSVQVVIDGIPVTNPDMKNILLLNEVESVELFKGAQNVLFGPYAFAGAMNIITKKPIKSGGAIRLGFGNDGQKELFFGYNYRINDVFSIGASFNQSVDEGWLKNIYDDKKYGGRNFRDYNLKLIYTPSDKTRVDVKYFSNIRVTDGPALTNYDFATNQTYDMFLAGISFMGRNINIKGPALKFGEFASDWEPYSLSKSHGISALLTHYLNDNVKFKFLTGYSKLSRYRRTDGDGSDITFPNALFLHSIEDMTYKTIFNDIRLEGEHEKIKWVVGVSNQRDQTDVDRVIKLAELNIGYKSKETSRGIYSQFTFSPIKQLDITFGGRLQFDEMRARNKQLDSPQGIDGLNIAGKQIIPEWKLGSYVEDFFHNEAAKRNFVFKEHMKNKTFVRNTVVTWKINPLNQIYYANYTGYKPGGYSTGIYPGSFNKQFSKTNEFGFKSMLFNNRLYFGGAIFDNKVKDLQTYDMATQMITNVGRVRVKGYELETKFFVTPELSIGANYLRLNPKIVTYGNFNQYDGKHFPWLPHNFTSINVTYNKELSNKDNLQVYVDYNLSTKQYIDVPNTMQFNNIKLVNASVTYQHKNHEVTLWGKNLANRKYYSLLQNNPGAGPTINAIYGRGRTIGASYQFKF